MVADESKISLEPSTFYRWSKKGKTPVQSYKILMHQSKTIYGALSIKTGKVMAIKRNKHKGIDTIKFLNEIKKFHIKRFEKENNKKTKVLLVWDNASWHKSKEIKQWLEEKNDRIIELMNFPGYSPELNPQENVWKQMKQHIADYRGTSSLNQITEIALKFLKSKLFKYSFVG